MSRLIFSEMDTSFLVTSKCATITGSNRHVRNRDDVHQEDINDSVLKFLYSVLVYSIHFLKEN